jgi:signal transduction histidine kinase
LGLVVTRLRSMFQPQIAGRKLKFQIELPEGGPKPVSDATLLMRVLANFLQNSIKFSQSGQTVSLRAALKDGRLRFEVQDMGPGVPDAEKELVFDKFYRATHAQSRAAPGTGIGLAFCRLAAEQLGGRVWAEDAPGGGSVFAIEVPVDAPARA